MLGSQQCKMTKNTAFHVAWWNAIMFAIINAKCEAIKCIPKKYHCLFICPRNKHLVRKRAPPHDHEMLRTLWAHTASSRLNFQQPRYSIVGVVTYSDRSRCRWVVASSHSCACAFNRHPFPAAAASGWNRIYIHIKLQWSITPGRQPGACILHKEGGSLSVGK
jgi:hypothetical protein